MPWASVRRTRKPAGLNLPPPARPGPLFLFAKPRIAAVRGQPAHRVGGQSSGRAAYPCAQRAAVAPWQRCNSIAPPKIVKASAPKWLRQLLHAVHGGRRFALFWRSCGDGESSPAPSPPLRRGPRGSVSHQCVEASPFFIHTRKRGIVSHSSGKEPLRRVGGREIARPAGIRGHHSPSRKGPTRVATLLRVRIPVNHRGTERTNP